MTIQNFEDLEIWKAARGLTQTIYKLTKTEKFSKDFALRDQLRQAAVSMMSNIAEGCERGGNQEFSQFLYVAKVHVVRCVHNFTWRSIKNTSSKT
jgi:four helix bundle protein